MILEKIIKQKRICLEEQKKEISIEGWKQKLKRPGLHRTLDFLGAIKNSDGLSIIGEIKKASPSKGVIRDSFDHNGIAREYAAANVQAVSVLTEEDFFLGSSSFIADVRQILPIPILRKDFIIDLWQVYESRYLGADAILLITSILTDEELRKFLVVSRILGLQCLVETHNRDEVERAVAAGASVIGINNRNLKTFEVDLKTTQNLINYIPSDRGVVSESGIKSRDDMHYLDGLGVDGVLIGELFMKSSSIKERVNELRIKRAEMQL